MPRCKEDRSARSPVRLRKLWPFVWLLPAACAWDGHYLVNTPGDFPDADPGDRVCAGRSDLCSLRAAVEETNTHPSGDRVLITVPAGTYELTTGGALILTHDRVNLHGDGRDTTTIRQTSFDAVLRVSGADVWIERVTVTGARLPRSVLSGGGIAIHVEASERVTLSQCRISGNQLGAEGLGAGVYASGDGRLNILNCVVDNNVTGEEHCGDSGFGGGVAVVGEHITLSLYESEIRDNCAGGFGGGVYIQGGDHHSILQSTIAGNESGSGGGLFARQGAVGRIQDSTIAGNSGGGVHISSAGSQFEIDSATIVGNTTSGDKAGGIETNAQVSLRNTVVANNTGAEIQDCSGQFFSGGGNFIGNHEPDCDIAAQPTDVLDGGDPGLGALASGVGPTRYMLPDANSELVDAGVAGCEPIDQRGEEAPLGAACDIGAVERP